MGQMLLNVTYGPTSHQATGLFFPTQTSISTKIFQEGMAALSEVDSFRLESLPRCIFNVLTYSFHGSGFMEAPPYRLSGKWLPTAPITLPNGKVNSCGQDTQNSGSAEGPAATAVPVFSWGPSPPPERWGQRPPPPPMPSLTGLSGSSAEPGCCGTQPGRPVWHN